MRSDAYILVTCDQCEVEMEVQLTATAGGYDERNVDSELKHGGWLIDGGKDICDDCALKNAGYIPGKPTSERDKHRYVRITWKDGPSCVVPPDEVRYANEDNEPITTEDVWMTDAEYEALREFEGGMGKPRNAAGEPHGPRG